MLTMRGPRKTRRTMHTTIKKYFMIIFFKSGPNSWLTILSGFIENFIRLIGAGRKGE